MGYQEEKQRQLDLRYQITDNTALVNNLLVESGSYNTFAQNAVR